MSALDGNAFAPLDDGQEPVAVAARPQPAAPEDIAAVLRDGAHRFPPVAASLHPLLCDAAARLIAIARATAGEVVVITARDDSGIAWHGASAGAYLYDSARPAWSDPRPGDADYLWGERARAVVEELAAAGWQQLAGPGRECLCLVARAGGAWLAMGGHAGAPAEFHAISPDRPLHLHALQHPAERRGIADLFRAMAPLRFVSVDGFAVLVALGEPEPEPVQADSVPVEAATERPEEVVEASPGLLARLLRRG